MKTYWLSQRPFTQAGALAVQLEVASHDSAKALTAAVSALVLFVLLYPSLQNPCAVKSIVCAQSASMVQVLMAESALITLVLRPSQSAVSLGPLNTVRLPDLSSAPQPVIKTTATTKAWKLCLNDFIVVRTKRFVF